MTTTAVYLIYLAAITAVVLPVARSLARAGATFLADDLTGRPGAGLAVGRIVGLGFALINLGQAFNRVQARQIPAELGAAQVADLLSGKLGGMLITVGITFALGVGIIAVIHSILEPKRRTAPTPEQPAAQN